MALTYDKVIAVISRPPDLRKDFEVNNLLPWFRKKSELFRTLKTDLLFDIIKNLQYITRNKDELIIKQGEIGDCMYILLRGKVTIYIQYNKTEDDGDRPTPVIANKNESIRQQLGTFVCPLGPGATFGEVALMSDDCIRTASIISDETSDLIVVDRELYNRSVKNVLKQEFEDKTNFIASNPFFQTWAPKYKKQLAMALLKETFPYEGVIAKQGEDVDAIYFILQGEVKLVVDPAQHKGQFPKLLSSPDDNLVPLELKEEAEEDILNRSVSTTVSGKERNGSDQWVQSKFRRKIVKKQPQEVCLLGVNESVGDIEVLLELESNIQTAICTQKTEVLVLEMKHYERLLVKRNPRTIENMKEGLELRLKSRVSKHVEKCCPIFKILHSKAEDYNIQRQQQNEARLNSTHEKAQKHTKTMSEAFDSFVPPRGPLIDLYGPGTVFHHIRERDKAKKVRQQKQNKRFGGYNGMPAGGSGLAPGPPSGPFTGGFRMAQSVDQETSDPVLTQLENRMRSWLQNDPSHRGPARVAQLHRTQTEPDHLKPGAKVVLRPKGSSDDANGQMDDEDMMMHTGHAWARTRLDHYNVSTM